MKPQCGGKIIRDKASSLLEKALEQSYSVSEVIWGSILLGIPLKYRYSPPSDKWCTWCVGRRHLLRFSNLLSLGQHRNLRTKMNPLFQSFWFPPPSGMQLWWSLESCAPVLQGGRRCQAALSAGVTRDRACRMLDNTGKEKEGILDLEPEPATDHWTLGVSTSFKKKKILGSWRGSKWKQKILSGRK